MSWFACCVRPSPSEDDSPAANANARDAPTLATADEKEVDALVTAEPLRPEPQLRYPDPEVSKTDLHDEKNSIVHEKTPVEERVVENPAETDDDEDDDDDESDQGDRASYNPSTTILTSPPANNDASAVERPASASNKSISSGSVSNKSVSNNAPEEPAATLLPQLRFSDNSLNISSEDLEPLMDIEDAKNMATTPVAADVESKSSTLEPSSLTPATSAAAEKDEPEEIIEEPEETFEETFEELEETVEKLEETVEEPVEIFQEKPEETVEEKPEEIVEKSEEIVETSQQEPTSPFVDSAFGDDVAPHEDDQQTLDTEVKSEPVEAEPVKTDTIVEKVDLSKPTIKLVTEVESDHMPSPVETKKEEEPAVAEIPVELVTEKVAENSSPSTQLAAPPPASVSHSPVHTKAPLSAVTPQSEMQQRAALLTEIRKNASKSQPTPTNDVNTVLSSISNYLPEIDTAQQSIDMTEHASLWDDSMSFARQVKAFIRVGAEDFVVFNPETGEANATNLSGFNKKVETFRSQRDALMKRFEAAQKADEASKEARPGMSKRRNTIQMKRRFWEEKADQTDVIPVPLPSPLPSPSIVKV